MEALTIPLLSTVGPMLVILAIAYPLRPQYGRLRPGAQTARRIRARLYNDRFPHRKPGRCWPNTTVHRHRAPILGRG